MTSFRPAIAAAEARWKALPGNFRGVVWALLAALAFSCMQVAIKFAGRTLPVWEIMVLRSAIALVFIAPAIWRAGLPSLRTTRPRAHLLRACLGFGGISTLVLSIQHLDLAIVATLGFTNTLFVIVFAWAFLGERIVRDRTLATFAGFFGVLVCLRPGPEGIDLWALVMLASAVFAAGVHTTIKSLTGTERPTTIMFYSYTGIMALSAIPCAIHWRTPTLEEMAFVGAMAACTAMGQTCMVLSLRAGEAVAVAPFNYTRILYATAFGFLLFGEIPAWTTFAGAGVIVAATLYLALRERRRPLRTPASGP
ncbi:MAG: DMT family transporter [Alphaproteobacteria bacterium]